MFCRNCGEKTIDNARFCSSCGVEAKPTSEKQIEGLVIEGEKPNVLKSALVLIVGFGSMIIAFVIASHLGSIVVRFFNNL